MSYLLCFWDKSKIQVTDNTGNKLKEVIKAGEAKTFELYDSLYSVSGIEKIIPKDFAYEVFPTDSEYLRGMETTFTEEECSDDFKLENSKPKQLT